MKPASSQIKKIFSGDGEMATLMRDIEWSKSPAGPIERWPQSLRITVSILLNSKFPMCLWWGPESLWFYNDAYKLALPGEKSESQIIGLPAEKGSPDTWRSVSPFIERVIETGESALNENQLMSSPRDGEMQKAYWTIGFSPVLDEKDMVAGVLGIYTETTTIINADKRCQDSEENEKQLKLIVEAAGLGTWELNIKSGEITYSDTFGRMLGYESGTKLTYAQILKHIHLEDIPKREKAIETAVETGLLNNTSRVTWPDGSVHWLEGKGKIFYDDQQQPLKLLGTVRDVTDEKRHQNRLEEREQKFRLLAESMPQFVWTGDAKGNLNYFNQAVFDFSGLSREQIEKDGWLQVVHPDDRDENINKWTHSIETGEDFIIEHRFRSHNGAYRWQLSRAVPQRDSSGKIKMWVGTSTDIEEQKVFASSLETQVEERVRELKKLNAQLKKSEERYHLMVEEVQDYAILYLNKKGVIENWNKGAEKIKGYSAEEIVGKNIAVFYTPSDLDTGLPGTLLDEAAKKGRAKQEGWRRRKDGSLFWASVVITALHDEKQNLIGFTKVTHDLSAKKDAEDKLKRNAEELEKKNAALQAMNAELQSFAYVSSHDLQEPLRKIQVFAAMILENESKNLTDSGKDYFRRMQNAAARMQTLIDDLLTYSRTNNAERNFEKIDLNGILEVVKIDLKEDILHKNAIIEANHLCEINVIPFQFRQLLNNLIGNALKFSKPDATPHIRINAAIESGDALPTELRPAHTNYCHLTISDNGIGFESTFKDRIFEVFQRLHGKAEYKGTGIGLAIVKKIVENHGGKILADGEVGIGATFNIYIPVEANE